MNCAEKKLITDKKEALREVAKEARLSKVCTLPTEPPNEDVKGLICWWCVHDLPQRPCLHLPIKYDDKRKIFGTVGNFCSWPCAKAYAINMGTARAGEIQSLLSLMRLQALGKHVPLWPAPKRETLACFGGTLTIEAFRKFGGLVEPPQLYYPFEKRFIPIMGGEQHVATNASGAAPISKAGESRRLMAIENSSTESDTLRLKRNKPLVRATSKLENALGIKRKGKEPGSLP